MTVRRVACLAGPSCPRGETSPRAEPRGSRGAPRRAGGRAGSESRPLGRGRGVRPVLLLPPFPEEPARGPQTLGCSCSPSCAISEAAAPGRPPRPLGYTRVAQTMLQIKSSSYHAGGLLYSSSGEPGPTLLHPRVLPRRPPSLSHCRGRAVFPPSRRRKVL